MLIGNQHMSVMLRYAFLVDPRDGRAVIHSRGNELHYLGVGFVGGDGEPDRALGEEPIAYASGAAVLYRAHGLRDVGLFDPALFMYHEDSDLGWRLRLAGWQSVLAPAAVIYHDYDFTGAARKGFGPNSLTPYVGDANIETPEYKAFLVDIEPITGPVA